MSDVALMGALVGGAISLGSTLTATIGTEWIKQRREARNLAYAFHGGISAILIILEERRYVRQIEVIIRSGRAGQPISPIKVRAQRNYAELYSKNVEKIGMLNQSLAEKIPTFYTCVNSLLEDIDSMYHGEYDELSQPHLLNIYEGFYDLLTKTIGLGNHILAIISEKYASNALWMHLPG